MVHYLIVGNGAAGLSAAEVIRQRDPSGRITIVTDEPDPFYSRPGIAYYLMGQLSAAQLISRDATFYKRHRLDLRHDTVTTLDLRRQVASLRAGGRVPYDALLLATGARAVPPPFPGGDLEGVITFDSLDDARHTVRLARQARAAVVVGGGITAMELAEGLHHRGVHTYFLQRRGRLWPRLFTPAESAIVEAQVRQQGIELRYEEEVAEILGDRGRVTGVRLQSGDKLACQIVGVAIGVRPNLDLLQGQAVGQDRGILVNAFLQSNVPTLFAAGDVAQVYDRWTEAHHLDVLWPSAINEGRAAGYNMVEVAHGRSPSYTYEKGTPFNAALLFGIHLTVIGRIGNSASAREDAGEQFVSYLSRGSSNVWTTPFSSSYYTAWDQHGPNAVRISLANNRIVGALLLGNQVLADPLRMLIEHEADVGPYAPDLLRNDEHLPAVIREVWHAFRDRAPAQRQS